MRGRSDAIETNLPLRCLRPVLEKWISVNRELAVHWASAGDAPWWYNERALISVFAGAVWRTGGHAFEEYSTEKRGDRRESWGRVDLEFAAGRQEFRAGPT